MDRPKTLADLKAAMPGAAASPPKTVRDEMRFHLLRRLQQRETLLPGIYGYEETVLPQIVNALLARHHFIMLGLRGQAKSRILRLLTRFLDEYLPFIQGCEIHDDPFHPICTACRGRVGSEGDRLPIAWWPREERFVEKLATPDVTMADIIGDVDPIKAAKGGHDLSSERTIHFGLLPRAHRGIFAVNELPDLAPRIQVGLFNIMQEGDIQIKGYPIRLPLDVLMVFSANPEDYTARGKIITPLKDRIGSEIRTHYPLTLDLSLQITGQEAWTDRGGTIDVDVPGPLLEIVEEIAIHARHDQRIDKRSGVSQRLSITCLENVVSNAERRGLINAEEAVTAGIQDIYASIPSITGKLELEYEGEQLGPERIARDLIRSAIGAVFERYAGRIDFQAVVAWFEDGNSLKLSAGAPTAILRRELDRIPTLLERAARIRGFEAAEVGVAVASGEFALEGLYARKKISRSEEAGFQALKERAWTDIDREERTPKRRLN